MKYKGREFNTLLIRQMRLAILNILPFHEVSFFQNLSMTSFHVEILLGLDPKGIPRNYMEENHACGKLILQTRSNKSHQH